MKYFVRPRCCQRLLFSSYVNGRHMVRLNFYQMFVLCAIKTAHCITHGDGRNPFQHNNFIYASACNTIEFAFRLILSKMKHEPVTNTPLPIRSDMPVQLTWKEALWLGKHAFYSVFRRLKVPQLPQQQRHRAELCLLFSESSRAANRKDLLAVSRQALSSFLMEDINK